MDQMLTHLLPYSQQVASHSDEERIAFIRTPFWIGYNRAQQALQKLEELLKYPQRKRMPNLLLIGPTNNGKTMIIEQFYRRYLPQKPPDNKEGKYGTYNEVSVFSVQMPSNPDVKRFYAMLLHYLGIDVPSASVRISQLESEVLNFLRLLKVKVLIIDEIHNLLAGRNEQQREFLNVLRFIGNELQVSLVCVGTKDAYLAIRSDAQLENRFEPFLLPPWEAGTEYDSLLASFEQILPLRHPSTLIQASIAQEILVKSEGILGEIVTFITRAAIKAIELHVEMINIDILKCSDYASPTLRRQMVERQMH